MKKLFVFFFLSLAIHNVIAQSSDTLTSLVPYSTFPIGAIRYPGDSSLIKMFGMNFNWYAWASATKLDTLTQQSGINDYSTSTRDPFYKDSTVTVNTTDQQGYLNNYVPYGIFTSAAYGKDIRVYLPGTSPVTQEYDYSWNNKSGYFISTSDPEWEIRGDTSPAGYVLSDLGNAAKDPYTASNPDHRSSFSYELVYFFNPTQLSAIMNGNDSLYSIEYWVKKSTDSAYNFYLADTITKNSYNALHNAITQVPGRTVGSENLSHWSTTMPTNAIYRIQKKILRIDTFYVGDNPPQVDVRLRNFHRIPIFVRCLRIRDWVAQRLLTGKADGNITTAISVALGHNNNNLISAWTVGNEPPSSAYHCFAYLNDLFVYNSAPPLSVLAPGNDEFVRVERDQSQNRKGYARMFLWDEATPFYGQFYRVPYSTYWTWDFATYPERPLPSTLPEYSDSAVWYNRAIFFESNYNTFTTLWQNDMGYSSEALGGGSGDMQGLLKRSKACYELDPNTPIPYWGCYQAGASPIHNVPLWSVDQVVRDSGYSSHVADSIYKAQIFDPYLSRHPGNVIVLDSIYHLYYTWRASTEAEIRSQLWMGIGAGLKGYAENMAFDDMGNNDGILWDTTGHTVKSTDRTEMRFDNSSDGSGKIIYPYGSGYYDTNKYVQKSTLLPTLLQVVSAKDLFSVVKNGYYQPQFFVLSLANNLAF